MKIDILSLFPFMFDNFLNTSIIKRAIEKKKVFINIIRNFMKDFSMIREEKDFTILMPIIGKVLGEYPEDYKGEAKDE